MPERSLYADAEDVPDDPIHDIKQVWQTIDRHDKLRQKLSDAKIVFPFVSFLCPLDVMERKVWDIQVVLYICVVQNFQFFFTLVWFMFYLDAHML